MNRIELKIRVDLFEGELKKLREIKTHCQSCEHYQYSPRPACDKWKSQIPPEVVQQGCEEWTYDFIPF